MYRIGRPRCGRGNFRFAGFAEALPAQPIELKEGEELEIVIVG